MAFRRYRRTSGFAMERPVRSVAIHPVELGKIADKKLDKRPENWHVEAFRYYDTVPEISFIVDVTAKAVAECHLVPEYLDPETGIWVETKDERVMRVMDALQGNSGEIPELIHDATKILQITGDCYLLGSPVPVLDENKNIVGYEDDQFLWDFLSTSEIKIEKVGGEETVSRKDRATGKFVQVGSQAHPPYIARMHRRHPEHSRDSDSAIKHVLDICRRLQVYDALIEAVAKSRLHAGFLYVPDELSFGPEDDVESQDSETEDIDPLIREILEYMLSPIADPTSPAAVAPMIIRGPADLENNIQLKPFERQLDQQYIGIRKELRDRLSIGLDSPPEVIDGKSSLNQWTGFQVESEFLAKHILPVGKRIARFCRSAYLIPMLKQYEGMDDDEARRYRIRFDASDIKVRSDEVATARRAYQDNLISPEAARRHMGFTEADAPDFSVFDQNRKVELYLDLIRTAPVSLGPVLLPLLGKAIGDPDLEQVVIVSNGEAELPDRVSDTEKENGGEPTRPVENRGKDPGGNPQPQEARGGRRPGGPDPTTSNIVTTLAVAADAAWQRSMERAASKYLTKAKASDQFANVPKLQIFSRLAPSDIRDIGETPDSMVDTGFKDLERRSVQWVKDWLEEDFCLDPVGALNESETIVSTFIGKLQEYTIANLYSEPARFDRHLSIPPDIVVDALTTTGRVLWDDTVR